MVGNELVSPTSLARNLGYMMDSGLSALTHLNQVCKAALFRLRNIAHIRKCLSVYNTKTFIHAFVTSRLDSLNSLLYGLPDQDIAKLK